MIDRLSQVNAGQSQEDLRKESRFGFLRFLLPFDGPREVPVRRAGWETPGSTVRAENVSLLERPFRDAARLKSARDSMEENERSVSQEAAGCRLSAEPSDDCRRSAVVDTEWCPPGMPTARLALPGVMDAEGRVDESRLRMHIFKNGNQSLG